MSSFLSETALLQDSKRRVCPNSFTAFSRPLSKVHLFLRMRPLRKESTYAFLEGAEGGRLVVEGQAEKAELEKTRYFGLDKTKPIVVKDGFVTFTEHFKYLRSYISYNLRDDFDIDLLINKAGQPWVLSNNSSTTNMSTTSLQQEAYL